MFSSHLVGTVAVVSGDEPLTKSTLEAATKVVTACLNEGKARIVLDLEQVPLIDSLGLEWLVESAEQCAFRGGRLNIAGANPLCLDVLRLTEVGKLFEKFPDVRSGVRSFIR